MDFRALPLQARVAGSKSVAEAAAAALAVVLVEAVVAGRHGRKRWQRPKGRRLLRRRMGGRARCRCGRWPW